jgi:hypothetical protein
MALMEITTRMLWLSFFARQGINDNSREDIMDIIPLPVRASMTITW